MFVDLLQRSALAKARLVLLNEYPTGATAEAVDPTLEGLQRLHQEFDHTTRRVELDPFRWRRRW